MTVGEKPGGKFKSFDPMDLRDALKSASVEGERRGGGFPLTDNFLHPAPFLLFSVRNRLITARINCVLF